MPLVPSELRQQVVEATPMIIQTSSPSGWPRQLVVGAPQAQEVLVGPRTSLIFALTKQNFGLHLGTALALPSSAVEYFLISNSSTGAPELCCGIFSYSNSGAEYLG